MAERLLLIFTAPPAHLDSLLAAIAEAGAGVVGEYTHCSFSTDGVGRFLPGANAQPLLGARGQLSAEPEVRVETFVARDRARAVVAALRAVHPYDEAVFYLVPLLDEADL